MGKGEWPSTSVFHSKRQAAGLFSTTAHCGGTSFPAPAKTPGGFRVCVCVPASISVGSQNGERNRKPNNIIRKPSYVHAEASS